ncbi:MAG: hypothetical protein K2P84_08125 [Undibacterium sp.]|nr:hypothetical protein [Undibacterium sp.]
MRAHLQQENWSAKNSDKISLGFLLDYKLNSVTEHTVGMLFHVTTWHEP